MAFPRTSSILGSPWFLFFRAHCCFWIHLSQMFGCGTITMAGCCPDFPLWLPLGLTCRCRFPTYLRNQGIAVPTTSWPRLCGSFDISTQRPLPAVAVLTHESLMDIVVCTHPPPTHSFTTNSAESNDWVRTTQRRCCTSLWDIRWKEMLNYLYILKCKRIYLS